MLAVVLLFSSAASFSVGPVGTQPVLRRMPARAAAPSLFLGKLFKKGEDGDAEPSKPAPAASAPKKGELSATDKILVQFGMKTEDECELVDEDTPDLMEQIKCSGRAGIISYIIWEWIFWLTAVPIACFGYYSATGSWPDLSDGEDQAKVAGSIFAFVNVARFAVPLRVGLALSTTPWVDDNIVQPFLNKDGKADEGKE